MNAPLAETSLKSLEFLHRGKVRDLYAIDAQRLLVIQTDRLSAFDVVLPDPIPGKGEVLTALSTFWFRRLNATMPNHLLDDDPSTVVAPYERDQVAGRAMVVRRLEPLLVEAVVRGYVAGSGWKDYQSSGAICGVRLPPGLVQAQKLPAPIFTPASKAPKGQHDENIEFAEVERTIGSALAARVRDVSLALYREASAHALERGIIIADTKFEFGTDASGALWLIDEALTPDSSRLWPVEGYRTGISPPAFDKQFVRDWLESVHWDKRPPAPRLPPDILAKTAEKYREALRLLVG
ncbi:MAG: phosphoribosylaminoimidazolesuccinocarboxamide synthase [Proteobacteria bacterium]|nr:phosphoribosylaminoimidazolesuccinocarboxamide synthase [Burkholderiales bacterium]